MGVKVLVSVMVKNTSGLLSISLWSFLPYKSAISTHAVLPVAVVCIGWVHEFRYVNMIRM